MLSVIILLGLGYIICRFFVTLFDMEFSENVVNKYNKIDNKLNELFEIEFIPNINLNPMPYIKDFISNIKDKLNNLAAKRYQLIDVSNQKITRKLKVTKTINPNNIITDYVQTDHNGFEKKWQVVEVTDPRLNITDETVVVQEFEETTETNSVSFA